VGLGFGMGSLVGLGSSLCGAGMVLYAGMGLDLLCGARLVGGTFWH
jgi:hypothetical protein